MMMIVIITSLQRIRKLKHQNEKLKNMNGKAWGRGMCTPPPVAVESIANI